MLYIYVIIYIYVYNTIELYIHVCYIYMLYKMKDYIQIDYIYIYAMCLYVSKYNYLPTPARVAGEKELLLLL